MNTIASMNRITTTFTPSAGLTIMSSRLLARSPAILLLACGLVAVAVVGVWPTTAAASEIMGALPAKAAPPAILKTHGAPHGRVERSADRCNGQCRDGQCGRPGCPAHCPVRPDRFGFYGTQWRTWPGAGVVQAAFTNAATPVRPPQSEVPSADEESPPAPEPEEAGVQDGDSNVDAERLPSGDEADGAIPAPAIIPEPSAEEPAEPAELPPAKPPAIEKPVVPAAEENLFDEASLQRRRRESLANLQQSALRSEQLRQEALRQQTVRRQPLRTAASPVASPVASEPSEPSVVRTVSHAEPSETPAAEARSQRFNPLR
jgi:hypothetical protein